MDHGRFGRLIIMLCTVVLLGGQCVKAGASEVCWWTGCQHDSWAARGCAQYNHTEKAAKPCDNGHLYQCCEEAHLTSSTTSAKADAANEGCWWTSCNPPSWAVGGCVGGLERNTTPCIVGHESGFQYHCCPGGEASAASTTTVQSSAAVWLAFVYVFTLFVM